MQKLKNINSDFEFFNSNGYIVYKNLISRDTIQKLENALRLMLIKASDLDSSKNTYDLLMEVESLSHQNIYNCSKAISSSISVYRLIEELGIINKAKELKNWNESCIHTTLFQTPVQFPSDDRFDFQWHQENGSYDLLPDLLTFWFPILHGVSEETGTFEFIPGSHHNGILPSKHVVKESKLNEWIVDVTEEQEKQKFIVNIEVGDVVCFDANLIHRSTPNKSNKPRLTGIMRAGNFSKINEIMPLALPCNYNKESR